MEELIKKQLTEDLAGAKWEDLLKIQLVSRG
jgi:hypothetical protein